MLLLRDAIQVKKRMFKDLDPERAKTVRKAIAKFYEQDEHDISALQIKDEFLSSWKNIKMPSVTNPFSSGSKQGEEAAPTETTSLV